MTASSTDGSHDGFRPAQAWGPLVNLHYVLGALRRRRRWWVGLGLAGLVLGLLLSVVTQRYSATTTLKLQFPEGADPQRAIATDTSLLQTRSVARRTIRALRLDVTPDAFLTQYSATPLSDELLKLTVSGTSSAEAVRRANALAKEFLAFRSQQYEGQLRAEVKALRDRQAGLQSEITKIDTGGAGGSGADDPAGQRARLNADIQQLQQTIDDRTLSTTSVVSTSRVIDPASPVATSTVMVLARNAATGAVGGMALGAGLVTVLAVVSDRVRRRGDISAAMAAPVALSVEPIRRRRWKNDDSLRARLRDPAVGLRKIAAHVRDGLGGGPIPGGSVVVVSVDSLDVTALAVAEFALEVARQGRDVSVVDLSGTAKLTRLLPAASQLPSGDHRGTTWVAASDDAAIDEPSWPDGSRVDPRPANDPQLLRSAVLVTLASLDPAIGAAYLRDWATEAIVIVTAGRSNASKLHSVAEMIRDAGLKLRSVVLVGADRDDDSLGTHDGSPRGNGEAGSIRAMSRAQLS